ncbi:hypothetical protein OA43_11630 [Klebsiella variicola]|uniref:Uncharacterized protein n=1 Tax=[Enterobacter] lignolyticus TaxID=1334193 RepID=A0A806X3M9_9ENTR|nr:hypothetical protein AO703_02590 [[Enterobacter] lignolyticus]KKY85652.1 hypothetical protein OA43_11630 [Klebsiella variicola]
MIGEISIGPALLAIAIKLTGFPFSVNQRPLDYGTIRSSNMRSPSFLILAMTTLMNIYDFWRMDLSKV